MKPESFVITLTKRPTRAVRWHADVVVETEQGRRMVADFGFYPEDAARKLILELRRRGHLDERPSE